MDVITGEWIKNRLSGQRGEKSRLAAAMRISSDKFSKVLNGTREVQPHEVPLVLSFFGLRISGTDERLGFAEPSVEPVSMSNHEHIQLIPAIAPGAQAAEVFKATKDYFSFGILTGDWIVTDSLAKLSNGDLAIVELNDPSLEIETLAIRRHIDGFLVEENPHKLPHPVRGSEPRVGRMRPICAVLRSTFS